VPELTKICQLLPLLLAVLSPERRSVFTSGASWQS
jgi:hypothetical protein